MIEQLPEDDLAPTQLPDKIRELVTAVNRLTELAKLGLGVERPKDLYAKSSHPVFPPPGPTSEAMHRENDLTWPKDTSILGEQPTSVHPTKVSMGEFKQDEKKGGLKMGPGIVRRPKEKP